MVFSPFERDALRRTGLADVAERWAGRAAARWSVSSTGAGTRAVTRRLRAVVRRGIRAAEWIESRPRVQYVMLAALLCLFLNFLFLDAYRVAAALSLDDNDFIIMPRMLEHYERYEGTVFAAFSEKLAGFNLFVDMSSLLWSLGLDAQSQYILFYFMMFILASLGMVAWLFAFELPFLLRLVGVFLIPLGIFHGFGRFMSFMYYGKATPSTIVLGLGFLALALFLTGRYRWATLIAALMFYLHPAHAGILVILIMGYLTVEAGFALLRRHWTVVRRYAHCCAICLLAVPFLTQYSLLAVQEPNYSLGLWLRFLRAKTSNPLPMGDGYPTVIAIVATLVVFAAVWARLLALQMARQLQASRDTVWRVLWVSTVLILFWVVQVYFTHWRETALVIKIVFTRATPYFGMVAILAILVATWWGLRGSVNRWCAAIPWAFLLLSSAATGMAGGLDAPALGGILAPTYEDIIKDAHDVELARHFDPFVLGCTLLALTLHGRWQALADVLAVVALTAAYLAFGGKVSYVFAVCALTSRWIVDAGYWARLLPSARWAPAPQVILVLLVPASIYLMLQDNVLVDRGIATVRAFAEGEAGAGDQEAVAVMDMIAEHTDPQAAIIHVPHGDDISSHILTERAVFLDRMETQYALYAPELTPMVVARLETYGIALDDIVDDQFCSWSNRYLWVFMCYRTLYFVRTNEVRDDWRGNLEEVQRQFPRVSYAVIRRSHACREDDPVAETEDHLLVPLGAVAAPGCTRLDG